MNNKIYTPNEIASEIVEFEPITVSIIQNHENKSEAVAYLDDSLMMTGFKIEYNFETLSAIKSAIDEDTTVFVFTDKELQNAWIDSYIAGGITEDRFDRRTEFHKFDEPHEVFAIDRITLMQFNGECEVSNWKEGIIAWYKNQAI